MRNKYWSGCQKDNINNNYYVQGYAYLCTNNKLPLTSWTWILGVKKGPTYSSQRTKTAREVVCSAKAPTTRGVTRHKLRIQRSQAHWLFPSRMFQSTDKWLLLQEESQSLNQLLPWNLPTLSMHQYTCLQMLQQWVCSDSALSVSLTHDDQASPFVVPAIVQSI